MKIYDVTLDIQPGLPVWPGDPSVKLERITKMEEGAHCNISVMALGVHTGTHVDAPYHFIRDGKTIETLSLDVLMGEAWVIALPDSVDVITAEVVRLAGIPQGAERVLFKTRNSSYWTDPSLPFQTGFVAVEESGAKELVALGVKLVGIDYLSVSPYQISIPTHVALLGAGVIALEGLNLSAVEPGKYQLCCLPMKLRGSDGAPARTVLISE